MIIKEINQMLDRQCIFSFAVNTTLEQYLTENGLTAIMRIRVTKEGGFALVNIENDGFDEGELLDALADYDPQVTADAALLRLELGGTPFLEAFRALNKVPSVVIDGVIFNGGYYYIYFRFHSVDEKKVGTAMRGKIVNFDRFSVRYLGVNAGMISTFREISAAVPLKYIEITGKVPPSAMNIANDPVLTNLGVSWTREMKYLLEDEIRAIYYDKSSLLQGKEDWINEISREKKIYETAFSNPLIQYFINQSSLSSIVTMGMPQKLLGKTFSIATVVPEMVMPEFFRVVYSAASEFKDWDLDIHFVDLFENMTSD